MSRRDALSRAGARLARPFRSVREGLTGGTPRGDRGRSEVTPTTRARQAAVVGTASLIALAPLAVGAPGSLHLPPSPRPAEVAAPAPAGGTGLLGGIEGPASLPWTALGRMDQIVPAAMHSGAPGATAGVPATVQDAYRRAETGLAATHPNCHLSWWMLAGIGYVESGHANGGQVDANGRALTPILGPVLDGSTPQTAVVLDTDRGVYDGNSVHDRAVGPMQFLPATWRGYGVDGNGDGVADPQNVYDAALSAGRYLCADGGDLRDATALRAAVLRYNPSETYVTNVLAAGQAYRDGLTPPPIYTPTPTPTLPVPQPLPSPVTRGTMPRDTSRETPPVIVADPPRATTSPSAGTPAPRHASPAPGATSPTSTPPRTPAPRPTTATPGPTRTTGPTGTTPPTGTPSPTPEPTPASTTTPSDPTDTHPAPQPPTVPPSESPETLRPCADGEDPFPAQSEEEQDVDPSPSPTCVPDTDSETDGSAETSDPDLSGVVPSPASTDTHRRHRHDH